MCTPRCYGKALTGDPLYASTRRPGISVLNFRRWIYFLRLPSIPEKYRRMVVPERLYEWTYLFRLLRYIVFKNIYVQIHIYYKYIEIHTFVKATPGDISLIHHVYYNINTILHILVIDDRNEIIPGRRSSSNFARTVRIHVCNSETRFVTISAASVIYNIEGSGAFIELKSIIQVSRIISR